LTTEDDESIPTQAAIGIKVEADEPAAKCKVMAEVKAKPARKTAARDANKVSRIRRGRSGKAKKKPKYLRRAIAP
jgi:hypothetical protein